MASVLLCMHMHPWKLTCGIDFALCWPREEPIALEEHSMRSCDWDWDWDEVERCWTVADDDRPCFFYPYP